MPNPAPCRISLKGQQYGTWVDTARGEIKVRSEPCYLFRKGHGAKVSAPLLLSALHQMYKRPLRMQGPSPEEPTRQACCGSGALLVCSAMQLTQIF